MNTTDNFQTYREQLKAADIKNLADLKKNSMQRPGALTKTEAVFLLLEEIATI
jgi:hypothetical protein